LFYGGGEWIFSLITSEPDAYRAGGLFLKIDSYSMIFMMLEITTQGVFYGTGRTVPPALVSITGNVLRIPLALLLGHWAVSMSSILKGCVLFGWLVLRRHVLLTGSTLRPRSGLLS
jgi:Na+-driven multidrug efflux pump